MSKSNFKLPISEIMLMAYAKGEGSEKKGSYLLD
jgi:hypothetical protein